MLSDKEKKQLKSARNDKELKKIFKTIASKKPDEFFPTQELRNLGYIRKHCECCRAYFWTTIKDRKVCGDPACSGGFQVAGKPLTHKLSYIGVWNKIVEILEPRGYKPIKRYPCVARWNPTSEFTIASISAFQPYVISGEVEPPAKKLIIPQFCLRFNDIENVGITGSHNTGFVMIGQHFFGTPQEWNQGQLFMDIHDFITIGVGLSKEEITIHEDSWAGGGSFGCSLEFFSRGVELFNQVYTMFEQTPNGPRELSLKVLDMGLGQERVAWFSQGTPNIYEAIFPYVLLKLREITKINLDFDLYDKFSKYSAYLNIDEVDDMDAAWESVAKDLEISVKKLREKIMPMTAIYSIADHARSLLFAINDGKLPSNVGGGYNLRVIFRRAISFIDKFNWDINIADVCKWHAEELKELFPEVSEHLDKIREILNVEKDKYYKTKRKASKILEKLLSEGDISTATLIEIYDSRGINPEMVKETAEKFGRTIKIPDNFYSLVVERHEKIEQIHATEKQIELDLNGVPETESLYYYDYTNTSNNAKVLKIIDNMVILDRSVAYPTSGGQLHDVGTINGQKFDKVFKQNSYIVHILSEKPSFKEGDTVKIEVDKEWRTQLSQHHTATHIVNAAARYILGDHINQAGAKKTLKRSHLDITHFAKVPYDKLKEIEKEANEIVNQAIDLKLSFMPRSDAEQKYGMTIYQGGAVPGKNIRLVEVPGVDVEACGGTHLNNTSETGRIKITKSQKIQDGIVRLTFTAGNATKELEQEETLILNQLESLFKISRAKIVGRVAELLNKWKNINKALQTGKVKKIDMSLDSNNTFQGDILTELSQILNTKKEDIPLKVNKLFNEWKEAKTKLQDVENLLKESYVEELINSAFSFENSKMILRSFENLSQTDLKNLSVKILQKSEKLITLFINKTEKGITLMGMIGKNLLEEMDFEMGKVVQEIVSNYGGKGGGKKDYGQGFIDNKDLSVEDLIKRIKEKLDIK
ncbi:MAG: alanine--tRNA ligase [Promethearchaeota archaeon Loki_b31]|nr:MAG: alanine--tRNA ligase [Candidatus Lokiarchaeota archaeon Loki_b31]